MILGLSSPTYSGVGPDADPLLWLLDRCADYDLQALEASLPLDDNQDVTAVGRKAADLGITWVGYWSGDFVTPEGGATGLRQRAEQAFDIAVRGGISTVVMFGAGSLHNRFSKNPPLAEQQQLLIENLNGVAAAAADRNIQLGLLPHLDYRAGELTAVMQQIDQPALKMAFDTTNPFPVCEDPVDAAQIVLPHAVAVALKDVQIYPYRSNDVTIWGTPIGQGSVDFDAILPMLQEKLPNPATTTVCVKLRLPPDNTEHAAWLQQSLAFLRAHPALAS